MGKVKKMIFLSVVGMLVSGCMNAVSKGEACDTLEKAAKNNRNLESARFETAIEVENGLDEGFIQETAGLFIKTGPSQYDWHYIVFFPGRDRLISQEVVERAGEQSQKVIVDPLEISEWVPVEDQMLSLEGVVGGLFETKITEEEIDAISVEEAESSTTYQLNMTDTYAKENLKETIGELKQQIEDLEEAQAEDLVIKSLKEQIRIHEATTFANYSLTYVVDDDDHLTRVSTEMEMNRDGTTLTMTHNVQLTDYNLANSAGLLPLAK